MKLLITTQVIDKNDQALGFFHQWVAALAPRFEHITVICLREGAHTLPPNVHVFSLGKEKSPVSSWRYALRFVQLAYRLRREYDAVFVHMNQEYLLIAGWLWKLLRKRMYMWRNHYAGSWRTTIAAGFCTNVFCTSQYSYTAAYTRARLMPVGVDLGMYTPTEGPRQRSVLFYARMAPSKRPDLLIEALERLQANNVSCTAGIYGTPLPQDEVYLQKVKERAANLHNVSFYPGTPPQESPAIYSSHEIYVDPSRSGMFNKTMFEAAACGALVLAASRDWALLVPPELSFKEGDAEDLARKLQALLELPESRKAELRAALRHVVEAHSLSVLVRELSQALSHRRAVLFQNGSMGDFLMFVWLAEQLYASGTIAQVQIVVPRGAAFHKGFVQKYPYVAVAEVSSKKWREVWRVLRSGSRQTIALIHPTVGRIPLPVKLFARLVAHGQGSVLIGFQDQGSLCSIYTHVLPYDTSILYPDTVRALAQAAGVPPDPAPPRIHMKSEEAALTTRAVSAGMYVLFHPGASKSARAFSVADAIASIRTIVGQHSTLKVLVSGSGREKTMVEAIVSGVASERVAPLLDASAPELAALLTHARLYIGTDTGVTHLACLVGAQVLEVAHHGTANWLAFYCPTATVLYRLAGEQEVHTERAYLEKRRNGRLKPLDTVPIEAIIAHLAL